MEMGTKGGGGLLNQLQVITVQLSDYRVHFYPFLKIYNICDSSIHPISIIQLRFSWKDPGLNPLK